MEKRKRHLKTIIAFTVLISVVISCRFDTKDTAQTDNNVPQEIMVYAAASLTDVLNDLIDSFKVEHNLDIKTSLASSGTLARQIEQGGAPDIFISASKRWADYVDSLGFFVRGHKTIVAENELVLISPVSGTLNVNAVDSNLHFVSLLGNGRLSIGNPAHVPAGQYAVQSLTYYNWYKNIKNKILPARDVRSALMVVEMGEAPLGIVYRTDAIKSTKVKILAAFPEKSHKPVQYIAGLCSDNDPAKKFLTYLTSGKAKIIWAKYGFEN